jgi:hypothetical protein
LTSVVIQTAELYATVDISHFTGGLPHHTGGFVKNIVLVVALTGGQSFKQQQRAQN